MYFLPPGNDKNQQSELGNKQNLHENLFAKIMKKSSNLLPWVLKKIGIKDNNTGEEEGQKQLLEDTVTNPDKLSDLLFQLQQNEFKLQNEIEQLKQGLEQSLEKLKKDKKQLKFLNWLLELFNINDEGKEIKKLTDQIKNTKTLFDVFKKLQKDLDSFNQHKKDLKQEIEDLSRSSDDDKKSLFNYLLKLFDIYPRSHINLIKEKLETNLINPISLLKAFSNLYKQYNEINSQLNEAKNSANLIQDQNKNYVQELEEENKSLRAKLREKNRNATTTITSDNSRPQRDTLIPEFKNLETGEFKPVTVQIFNYLMSINPELKHNRKPQEAKIMSILSQRILIDGSNWITDNNNMSPESNPLTTKAQDMAQMIVKDLSTESSSNIPKKITVSLKKLAQKGLELVRNIANAQPPGELWIEPKGTDFSFDEHEYIPGSEANGKILYTTYPGYRIPSRILVKAKVFIVPKQENNPSTKDIEITPNTDETTQVSSELSVADKVKALNEKTMTDDDIATELGVIY